MADNSFLAAWKAQLEIEGNHDTAALAEALAFERDRSEIWRSAVVASTAAYDGTRKLLKSYDDQLKLNMQRFSRSSYPDSSYSAILECVVHVKALLSAKTREELDAANAKVTASMAAIESDDFQRTMVEQKEAELSQ